MTRSRRWMRLRARDTSVLAVGAVASGLLAYGFFATTTRALGPTAAAPVSVLWTYWGLSVAVFTFPLQHWIARTVSAYDEGVVRRAVPRLVGAVIATGAVLGVLSWLAGDNLFSRDGGAFAWLVVTVTLGSGLMGVARGMLVAHNRYRSVATMLVAENAVRCLAAMLLAVAGVTSPVAFGLCLLGGYLVPLCWPSSLRPRSGLALTLDGRESRSPFGFLSRTAVGQLLSQLVLTGAPLVLVVKGGTPTQVTALFATLALFRAPYTLALGLVSPLTGRLTTLVVTGKRDELHRFRSTVVVVTAVGTSVAGVTGWTVGPALVQMVFGADVSISAATTTLVAVGSAVALANLVMTVVVLALDRPGSVAGGWAAGTVVGGVVLAFPASPLQQTCWALVAAQVVALTVLVIEESRGRARVTAAPPDERPSIRPAR